MNEGEMPTRPDSDPEFLVGLTGRELGWMVWAINDAIIQADKSGISRQNTSSVFRERLFQKLLQARTQAYAPVVIPPVQPAGEGASGG